ncbi:MAG TPA: DUF481 domain-containing protein [Chitinophagaceae bacterium]
MGKNIFLYLILLLSTPCMAQFNDSTHYYLKFASTGVINKTSDGDSYVFNNRFDFNSRKNKVSFNTNIAWIYGEQQQNLTNNDFAAHGDIDLGKDLHKLYYWGLLNYDKSYSLKINDRVQAGGGVAFDVIDSPYLKFNISDGLLYEKGNLADVNNSQVVYQIPRNSFRLAYHWSIKDRFIIDGMHFYQPSLKDISDYTIQSTSSLSVKLKKWLSVTGSLVYNKVTRTKRENLLITYGVVIEKYF